MKIDGWKYRKNNQLKPINSLDADSTYKFLEVLENVKQKDKFVLESAEGAYLQRVWIILVLPTITPV